MAQSRSPKRISLSSIPANSPLSRRKYTLLRPQNTRKRARTRVHLQQQLSHASLFVSEGSLNIRPALYPIHPNLRRLPSRLLLSAKETMRDNMGRIGSAVGVKRKRVVSGNEPSHSNARPAQESGRHKRLRSSPQDDLTEEEEDQSPMEVDTPERWSASDESEEEDASDNSTDDYFINIAMARELLRLRKDELIRIYEAAGLSEDVVAWTKQEITEAIISSRDEVADLPPSSPGRTDAGSSECSSEDGNEAEDDAEIGSDSKHRLQNGLRRRATINDLGRLAGKPKGQSRSLSLDHINTNLPSFHGRKSTQPSTTNSESSTSSRRKIIGSNRSSSSAVSQTTDFLPTPLASRLRPRKVSAHSLANGDTTTPSSKGKAKAKQVEFDDDVTVRIAPAVNDGNESDLTDLAELEEQPSQYDPSPRRLRSKGPKPEKSGHVQQETAGGPKDARRVVPMRKAKGKIGSLKEDDDEDDEEEVEEEVEIEVEEEAEEAPEEVDELIVDSGDDEAEDEEVDELISTTSASPSPPPPKKRNISTQRPRPKRVQTFTPPSDSDGDDVSGEGEGDETLEEEGSAAEEDDETVVLEPKILRNGKVVGDELEEDLDVEEDIGEEDDEDLDEGGSVTDDQVEEEVEIDQVGMDDEGSGSAEEDVDLTIMTAKALVRLRRDDLVRMCESRDLDVAGTKPQLAEALLQWRNRRGSDFSSPSSSGTARPSSTARPQNGRSLTKSQSTTPPVLLRSHRFHLDEPRTPPVSSNRKDNEQELELDLGRLGLDDREIPPEKLTKLEKIGSGGFKDVFIGKFRGRKIAIAEFRGQLNSMDIKELKLLGGFDHPNIVRFLGVSIPENTRETPVMIVSELCSNGDLFDYVRNVPPPTLHRVVCMMLDIARGLEYLHLRKPSVIHRDCKSSNILITSKGVAKIADFGLAKVKQSTRSMVRSLVGTVNWQAPELWHAHPKYNHKVDVFSCAMVYWEMLQWYIPNKKYPWEGMNEHAIYDIVGAKRQRPSVSGLRKQWCPEIVDLMERMWAHEHQDRPTMSDVVKELEQLTGRR